MIEVWRDIKGYEGSYRVSNLGRIKSLNYRHTGKEGILKPKTTKNGYLQVNLQKDNKCKHFLVHRLVALAFVDGYKEGLVVNHKDENKQNNIWTNLEWCTSQYNSQYSSYKLSGENCSEETRKKMSDSRKGEKNPNYGKGEKVRNIETGEVFGSLSLAGKSINRHHSNIIRAIKNGWKCGGHHWEYVD